MKNRIAIAAAAILASSICASAWAAPSLSVSVTAGSSYSHTHWFGPAPVKLTPQIAVWVETENGAFVDTIYVTHRSAYADWRAAKGVRRPEALPVWSHACGIAAADGLFMPDAAQPLPDAVSGATPTKSFIKTWAPPASLPKGTYIVKAELNSSYDWNAQFPDKLSAADPRWTEANGQPSIIWEGRIELGGAGTKASLFPSGTGSLRGEDGTETRSLAGITSARGIALSIAAEYRP
jgi:hypothetical protein